MQAKSTLSQRLTTAIKHEPVKFAEMGYGKYIAMFTFALYFTVEFEILKLIWPSIHGLMPDLALYIACSTVLNLIIMAAYNLAMYFIYTMKIPFFEQFRVNKDAQWPWQSNPQQWKSLLTKTLKVTALNIFVVGPLLSTFDALIEFNFKMDAQSIPEVTTIMWQFIVFLAVEEVTFYFAHRLIHLPQFYWIHKDHHEYNVTIALAAQYAHPIEQILANSIPAGLGYKMLSKVYPVHMVAIIIWLSFRLFETCDGHSGYNWPWGQSQLLPFSAGGSYHYFHHKQNVGNYGAIMTIFDTIFDTNKDYNKYEDLKKKKLRND